MSTDLLPLLGAMEKELSLLDGIIQDIYIFEVLENEMVVNYKFKISENYPPVIIGGLVGTINEFAGRVTNRQTRTVVLKNVKLIFTNLEKFFIVVVVDPSYNDEQFTNIMNILFDTYLECLDSFKNEEHEFVDELAINSQFVLNFLSEEVEVQLLNGKIVSLYPYRLRDLAESRSSSILTIPGLELLETDQSEEIPQEAIPLQSTEPQVQTMIDEGPRSKSDALYQLMNKFVRTFTDALQVTLIRIGFDGTIYKTSAGRLEDEIEQNVYEVISSLKQDILELLDKPEDDRIIDLDDKWVFFQKVNPKCFVYLTVENKDVLALIKPLITRISSTIATLFPEDTY